jgi:hypothetical protein
MTPPDILSNLRRQHQDLVDLWGEFLAEPASGTSASCASIVHRPSLFEGKLRFHLSMEDAHFHPRLRDRPSERAGALTRKYIGERGGINDTFNAFILRWKRDSSPEGFPGLFSEEFEKLVATVRARREKRCLTRTASASARKPEGTSG